MQLTQLSTALTRQGKISLTNPARLFGSVAGRSGLCYTSANGGVSWDDLIAQNEAALAAGRPQDCQLFSDAAGTVPVLSPIGAGQGLGLLLDRSLGLTRGSNLSSNPTYDTGLDQTGVGNTGLVYWDEVNKRAVLQRTGLDFPQILVKNLNSTLQIGRYYEISIDITNISCTKGIILLLSNLTSTAYTQQLFANSSLVGQTRTCKLILPVERAYSSYWLYLQLNSVDVGGEIAIDNISVREIPGNHLQQPTAVARGEFTKRYNLWTGTAVLGTQNASTIAAQYRMYFTGAGSITLSGSATGTYSAGSHLITCTAGTLTATVTGSVLTGDLRPESDAIPSIPAYQRVTSATDYDEVGFPTRHRAVTDDWAKAHVNPAGATQAYVWWAGQKMSDAALGNTLEVGNPVVSSAGTLTVNAPRANGFSNYGVSSRSSGSANYVSPSNFAAPKRDVLRAYSSILDDVCALYVNGEFQGSDGSDQGTGTYTEQDVYVNSRAGTSLFANVYTSAPPMLLFLQPGDSLSDSQIRQIEKRFAKALGVTL